MTYRLPVVDPNDSGGAEGIYKDVDISAGTAPDYAFGLMLGYLVQTWARVNHCGPAQTELIENFTGEKTFLANETSQKNGKEWRVSAVAVEVVDYPKSKDLDFGDPGVIYAGKFSWLRNTAEADKADWLPVAAPADLSSLTWNPMRGGIIGEPPAPPNSTTGGISLGLGFVAQGAPLGQSYNTWDIHGDWARQNPFDPSSSQFAAPGSLFIGGAVSLDFRKRETPKPFLKPIAAGVSNEAEYQYPLQWINFERCWFDAPHPNVNGFTIWLKPGVTARATVLLTVRDPYVIVTGGSFGGG